MIVNNIVKQIKEMKNYRDQKSIKDNAAKQERLDDNYKNLVNNIHELVEALYQSKEKLGFTLSEELLNDLENTINQTKMIVQDNFVTEDQITIVTTKIKEIQMEIQKSWNKYYKEITSSSLSTLRVVASLNPENITKCQSQIMQAENWSNDINVFSKLKKGIEEAEKIVQDLSLDEGGEIVEFLIKMNSGKATLNDISRTVLEWLKNENLDKKVRLKFIK